MGYVTYLVLQCKKLLTMVMTNVKGSYGTHL